MKKETKPWKDNNGKTYPTSKLRIISKDWDNKTWYRFLRDDVDVYQREMTLDNPSYSEKIVKSQHNKLFKKSQEDNIRKNTKKVIGILLTRLPKKEQQLIKLIYWDKKINVEAAKIMITHEVNIHRIHKRAIKRLKKMILETVEETFPANKFCTKKGD